MARNISKICILQTFLFCNGMMLLQSLNWRQTKFHHFVVWVESQKVNWSVGSKFIIYKSTQSSFSFQIISNLRNNKISNLRVNLCFILDFFQSLENRFSTWNSYILSYKLLLPTSLKVYSYAIQEFAHHIYRFRRVITI